MYKEIKYTKDMSNQEIVYVCAKNWIDEICFPAVRDADELMSNEFTAEVIRQAAEQKLMYEEKRKIAAMKNDPENFWYVTCKEDRSDYETVLYDCLFRKYGANNKD